MGLGAGVAFTSCVAGLVWYFCGRAAARARQLPDEAPLFPDLRGVGTVPLQEGGIKRGPRRFKLRELAAACSSFSQECELGKGGFGVVYKGRLHPGDKLVAIKKMRTDISSSRPVKAYEDYVNELTVVSQLAHKNLVQLIGYCCEKDQLLFVYEFMPNRSLDQHLAEGDLDWPQRYNIAVGLASALHYMHDSLHERVLHRDVKPSNVMLDAELNAKLGDFGLAMFTEHGKSVYSTCAPGSLGYMSPEYVQSGTPNV